MENASNDELYIVAVEANTLAAPTVWATIGILGIFGATEVMASMGDSPAATAFSIKAGFKNYAGYQVRLKTWVSGTVATGINFGAKFYPVGDLQY